MDPIKMTPAEQSPDIPPGSNPDVIKLADFVFSNRTNKWTRKGWREAIAHFWRINWKKVDQFAVVRRQLSEIEDEAASKFYTLKTVGIPTDLAFAQGFLTAVRAIQKLIGDPDEMPNGE